MVIKNIFGVLFSLCFFCFVQAQPATSSYSDPAQQYNRLTREKFNNSYTLIGAFKVTGNPYLYGGENESTWYLKDKPAGSGKINYNTYNQQAGLQFAETTEPLLQDITMLDSFTMAVSSNVYSGNLKFINASRWNGKNKFFVQEVSKTASFTLYKRFYSELAIVTTNYVQSELREFELKYEYYYLENGTTELKKLKTSANSLKSEFASKKDCWSSVDFTRLNMEKEMVLIDFFERISNCK